MTEAEPGDYPRLAAIIAAQEEVDRLGLVTHRHLPQKERRRCAICARVSTRRQVQGYGLSRQLDTCRAWADQHEMCVVAEHYGWESAYTDDINRRPLLQRLLSDAEHGLIDAVVFEATDRAVRNAVAWGEFSGRMIEYGVDVQIARPEEDDVELRQLVAALRS